MKFTENTMFDSAVDFSQYVENQAYKNHSTILETLIKIIEECDINIEKIKPMLSDSLRDKLRKDFVDCGMLKRGNDLSDLFN
jgi:hypothetical protein